MPIVVAAASAKNGKIPLIMVCPAAMAQTAANATRPHATVVSGVFGLGGEVKSDIATI
jgi:hypothetical protein